MVPETRWPLRSTCVKSAFIVVIERSALTALSMRVEDAAATGARGAISAAGAASARRPTPMARVVRVLNLIIVIPVRLPIGH